ncbi:hypothetical protein [Lapillicoccus jejuensis]|uniref:Uncharacterized protein n=1 Tax=Lapillicoccus jejuensis TaxID=402171 RepID=A0A542E4N3_9MICO|nr:hypothetical protein [Lapillicoccus jejuensis]TQJ10285.1 hypothetical protein FB458_3405 [Lapillicoccus jejuensis]
MEWWTWLVVVLGVAVLAVALFLGVQARRRRGGVIVDPSGGRKPGGPQGGGPGGTP